MARIDQYFKFMKEQGASDLHLSTGNPPILRINGEMIRVEAPPFVGDDLKALVYEIAPEQKIKQFEETGDVDFGYEYPGFARYRANFFNQKYGIGAVFRLIPSKVLTAEQLGLPPVITQFAMLKKGLVLVTGPTGSGKSTTLAAVVDYANLHRKDHILTVEDPIEFVHQSQQSLVNHREVGMHTKSFASALRGAGEPRHAAGVDTFSHARAGRAAAFAGQLIARKGICDVREARCMRHARLCDDAAANATPRCRGGVLKQLS